MKTRSITRSEESEINITPMLDVVFIMLIFFIVTTSFVKETGLGIFKASHTTDSPKVKNAIIKLNATDSHTVNGIETSLEGIGSLLANLKASYPELSAQILAAAEVKTGDLVQTIQQIKENGIEGYAVRSF